jgi:hypothetical protein
MFHADRLATYVDFVGALTVIGAAARVWLRNGAQGRLRDRGGLDAEKYVESLARTRMLAKPPLLKRTVENTLTLATSAFEKAAKQELGIE